VSPNLPCPILYIIPALHGKATAQVIEKPLQLRDILTQNFGFSPEWLAFHGDSMFNSLHTEFEDNWTQHVSIENPELTLSDCSVIVSDPLHLMKSIRYRWASSEIAIAFGADPAKFSLRTLEGWNVVSPVVFMNSHITKMHDSLPLHLFSPTTFSTMFRRGQGPEFIMAPWCLLTAALILRGQSTRTRLALVEIVFWFLFIYRNHLKLFGDPPRVTQKKADGKIASMYTTQQLRHALNTFIAPIVILQHSVDPVC
jgi:hypothetical protein